MTARNLTKIGSRFTRRHSAVWYSNFHS